MAGFLMAVAGGALQGTGQGIVAEARAKREAALEAMREQRADARSQTDRDWRSAEADEERSSRTAENDKERTLRLQDAKTERDWRTSEAEKQRAGQGDVVQLDDGSYANRTGSSVKPLTTEDGKPVKLRSVASGEKSAEIKSAEWLIENGVAKDPTEAWEKVKSARDNPNSRAKLVLDTFKIMKEDYGDQRTDDEKRQAAEAFVDGLTDGADAARPADSAKISPAPRDAKMRVVGTIYTSPKDGSKIKWMGDGWEPVP